MPLSFKNDFSCYREFDTKKIVSDNLGFFREYDYHTQSATYFVPPAFMLKLYDKQLKQGKWQGLLVHKNKHDPNAFRSLKNNDRIEMVDWVEDLEAYLLENERREEVEINVEMLKLGDGNSKTSRNQTEADIQFNIEKKEIIPAFRLSDFKDLSSNELLQKIKTQGFTPQGATLQVTEDKSFSDLDFEKVFSNLNSFNYGDFNYTSMDFNSMGFSSFKFRNLSASHLLKAEHLIDLLNDNSFKLLEVNDIYMFLKQGPKDPTVPTIEKKSRPKRKRTHFPHGTVEYINLGRKLKRIKDGYLRNKRFAFYLFASLLINGYIKRNYQIILTRNSQLFLERKTHLIFSGSGSGKTTLANNFPDIFHDLDSLLTDDEKKEVEIMAQKALKDGNWEPINNFWRLKVHLNQSAFKGKILLAHSPYQIPDYLMDNSVSFVLLPSDYKDIRLAKSNLLHLCQVNLPKLVVSRDFYLFATLVLFNLDIIIKHRNFVRKVRN
jgi:hypothetical protein